MRKSTTSKTNIINTESHNISNNQIKENYGITNTKKNISNISIQLYDIDYAIKYHIENIIKPTVIENNSIISVPVMFANGDKWIAVQKYGYLRDNQGKSLTPLLMIKRNGISNRDDLIDLKVLETPDNQILFKKIYSKEYRYDKFNINTSNINNNNIDRSVYYSIDVPKYIQIEYDLYVWTNNIIQMNEIIEQLIWFSGKAFGDTYKFITYIDPPSLDITNNTGEDRIIKSTLSMRTKGHIIPPSKNEYMNTNNRLIEINKISVKLTER